MEGIPHTGGGIAGTIAVMWLPRSHPDFLRLFFLFFLSFNSLLFYEKVKQKRFQDNKRRRIAGSFPGSIGRIPGWEKLQNKRHNIVVEGFALGCTLAGFVAVYLYMHALSTE